MKRDFVSELFAACGIKVISMMEISNQYWPACDNYRQIRYDNPWWLVRTKAGVIVIGHRKRVTEVNWELTDIRQEITTDDVTKTLTYVHAWNIVKLAEYLQALSKLIKE